MVGKVHLVLHTVLCITLNIVLKHTSHNAAHGCHKYSKCYECCLKYSKCYDCHHKYSSEVESAEKCHEGFGASQQRSQLLFRTWNNFFNCHVGTNPCAILQIFKPVLKSGVDASLKKTALGKPAMEVPNPLNIYIYIGSLYSWLFSRWSLWSYCWCFWWRRWWSLAWGRGLVPL